jgi:hypothetical protein
MNEWSSITSTSGIAPSSSFSIPANVASTPAVAPVVSDISTLFGTGIPAAVNTTDVNAMSPIQLGPASDAISPFSSIKGTKLFSETAAAGLTDFSSRDPLAMEISGVTGTTGTAAGAGGGAVAAPVVDPLASLGFSIGGGPSFDIFAPIDYSAQSSSSSVPWGTNDPNEEKVDLATLLAMYGVGDGTTVAKNQIAPEADQNRLEPLPPSTGKKSRGGFFVSAFRTLKGGGAKANSSPTKPPADVPAPTSLPQLR